MGRGQIASQKRHVAFRIRISGRAVREIGEARDWYEARSPGLGSEFESAPELQLKRLEQTPELYAEVLTGVRRALLPRFPYGVFLCFAVIWCIYWPSFTMCAIQSGGPSLQPVNRLL